MNGSKNVLIVCATVMFCFIMATTVSVIFITNNANAGLNLIVILLGALGPTIGTLSILFRQETAKQTAEQTAHLAAGNMSQLHSLTNGGLSDAIKTAIRELGDEEHASP